VELAGEIRSLRRASFQKPADFDGALDAAVQALPASDPCHDDLLGMGVDMPTFKRLGVFGPCQRCRADVLRAVIARILRGQSNYRGEINRLDASFVNVFGSKDACDHIQITGGGWISK
jgi:hypothetical protein